MFNLIIVSIIYFKLSIQFELVIKLDQAWILPTVQAGHFHYWVLKPKLKVVALKLFKWLSYNIKHNFYISSFLLSSFLSSFLSSLLSSLLSSQAVLLLLFSSPLRSPLKYPLEEALRTLYCIEYHTCTHTRTKLPLLKWVVNAFKKYLNWTVGLFTVCQGCANFDSSKDLSNQMEIFLLVVQNFKLCQAAQLIKP